MLSWTGVDHLVKVVRERLQKRVPASAPLGLRPAAVLIPIVVEPEGPSLLLTRRAQTLRRQPGDISFPGGAVDPSDPTPLAAALRESREEVGLDSEAVTLLGQMDERGTVTGFRITPSWGRFSAVHFEPNHEVGELLQSPSRLSDPAAFDRNAPLKVFPRGLPLRYREHDIWGITGQLVKDLS
jgi:8-oxo-dGTP pyrophosphatase MutT (NUDIX family)